MAEQCKGWLRLGPSVECSCILPQGHEGRHEAHRFDDGPEQAIDVKVSWTITEKSVAPQNTN